jgi:nitroimidazol reductase NimA-like FMN-containing flavoprotein (pyridoxamine 5'-phosphate oxidase superfamily)
MVATQMTDEEISEFLKEHGSGVLSLSDGGETYAVPESFGYDGGSLYFQLVYTDDSHKMTYIETTEIATFTVSDEDPAQSVIIRGPLNKVPDDQVVVATNAIAENAALPTLNVLPDTSLEDLEMEFYQLTPTEQSGRKFGTIAE